VGSVVELLSEYLDLPVSSPYQQYSKRTLHPSTNDATQSSHCTVPVDKTFCQKVAIKSYFLSRNIFSYDGFDFAKFVW